MKDEKLTYVERLKKRQKKQYIVRGFLVVAIVVFIVLVFFLINTLCNSNISGLKNDEDDTKNQKAELIIETPEPAVSPTPDVNLDANPTKKPGKNKEESVYTYLQGPRSWNRRIDWSGSWGEAYVDGGSFGGFGCGLCCLANVYSTLSQYRCTPMDMYRFAKKNTYYEGGSAISWGYMKKTAQKLGLNCRVSRKPRKYSEFQKQIKKTKCSIVLVSSSNSKCYWKNTPGHYVTIFLYDEKKDRVFLADSGDPDHNRHWVSLKKIYRSLKTASDWQYMKIGSYNEKRDIWRHKSIKGNWVRPDYIKGKA